MEKQETKLEQENKKVLDEEQLEQVSGGNLEETVNYFFETPEKPSEVAPMQFPTHWA